MAEVYWTSLLVDQTFSGIHHISGVLNPFPVLIICCEVFGGI